MLKLIPEHVNLSWLWMCFYRIAKVIFFGSCNFAIIISNAIWRLYKVFLTPPPFGWKSGWKRSLGYLCCVRFHGSFELLHSVLPCAQNSRSKRYGKMKKKILSTKEYSRYQDLQWYLRRLWSKFYIFQMNGRWFNGTSKGGAQPLWIPRFIFRYYCHGK